MDPGIRQSVNICLVILGGVLLVAEQWFLGIGIIVIVLLMEVWELFRSQVIVQDWNNRIFKALLEQHGSSHEKGHSG